jgi:rRNA-processing protein FCF1
MAFGGGAYLLVDANVLIDYVKAERSILALVARHLGEVRVLSTILAEVDQLDAEECERLGLQVVEPDPAQVVAAAERRGRLSFQDHLCLLVARERGWTCVTNDGALRRALGENRVPTVWGLELMVELVRIGQLDPGEARAVAETIHTTNPLHIRRSLVEQFAARIREVWPTGTGHKGQEGR